MSRIDDAAVDRRLAIGECVERIDQLLGADSLRRFDFDLHVFRREVVHAADLQLALHGILDRRQQRFGRGRRRNLFDDTVDSSLILIFARTFTLPLPSAYSRASINPPVWKSGRHLNDCFFRIDLRLEQFRKIVRQDFACHATAMPSVEHQQQRQLCWERDGFFVATIVARDEFGHLVVEDFIAREFGEAHFDVSRGGGWIARENIPKISLALDQVTLVRQHHQRVRDRNFAVRMVLRAMPGDRRDLDESAIILFVQRPQNAALRASTVRKVRNRAVANDVGRVLKKAVVHPPVQRQFDGGFAAVAVLAGRHIRFRDNMITLIFFIIAQQMDSRKCARGKPTETRRSSQAQSRVV